MKGKPSRRRFIRILAAQSAALLASAQFPLLGRSADSKLVTWQGIALGAEASIQLHASDKEQARKLLSMCVSEIQRLERIFSLYDEKSALAQLNRNGTLENPPAELVDLLLQSIRFGDLTKGVFDITIHPIINSYRIHFGNGGTGIPENLHKSLALVDYRQIKVSPNRISLPLPQAAITLNGVAQGYITDRIAELLRSRGVSHTLIDLGEKRALDQHPDGRPWNIALSDSRGAFDVVSLNNMALSSSGGYGTPFDKAGIYHHLIDPRSGLSVNHHQSVHVIARDATTADALSTALATCKPEESEPILSFFPEAKRFTS